MNSFYSILSINIRPEIDEKLTVGMLMVYGEQIFFQTSKTKLSIAQRLISKSHYNATNQYLRLIHSFTEKQESNDLNLIIENNTDKVLSERYIEYLSRYNNNLISFSSPKILELAANKTVFEKLFIKLIDSNAFKHIEKRNKEIDQFKKNYYPSVKHYFNIEQEIDNDIYDGLLSPVKIDLIGKNGREVFAHSIDFEKNIQSIDYNIGGLLQIDRALPEAKKFILGVEPDKELQINHRIWNNLRTTNEFEYIDLSEAEKLTEYAIKNGVKPIF